jgi:phosphoribosylanthranilate isomerase
MILKICGVKDEEELDIVEKYADFTGVIVKSNSERCITLDRAAEMVGIANIPVFIVSTIKNADTWIKICDQVNATHIQIHSVMSPEDVNRLTELGLRVAKTFFIAEKSSNPKKDAENIAKEIEQYSVDYIILDTGAGSGRMHDLRVSKIIAGNYDVILAGGLNAENVGEVVRYVKPAGVDVSSGVELNGRKDEKKIREFFEAINRVIR